MKDERKITVKSATDNLKTIREFVAEFAKEHGFGDKQISELTLAVDEAATNIIKHAYKFNPEKEIIITASFENNELKITLRDFGEKFDPDKAPLPDIKNSLKLKKGGGLGIYLMRKLTDELVYNLSSPDFNEISLIKRLK